MFIYADESGHSGRQIFNNPPYYQIGALLSITDMEQRLSHVIADAKAELGVEKLHATELPPHVVAGIVPQLLDVLDESGPWRFFHGKIQKQYVATTKFVDLVFDAGENLAVPNLWYNHQGFRHALCVAVDDALRDRLKREFWDAFLADDIAKIQGIVGSVGQFIRMRHPDKRLREVARDAFAYVQKHPNDFTMLATEKRRGYQPHTPNIIGFTFVFQAVHQFYADTGSKPIALVHDRQQEFAHTMRETAKLFGRVEHSDEPSGFADFSMSDYSLPDLLMPSSADVAALQTVDLLLWTLTRDDAVLAACRARLEEKTNPYEISRAISEAIVRQHLPAGPMWVPNDVWERGHDALASSEEQRLERVRQRASRDRS